MPLIRDYNGDSNIYGQKGHSTFMSVCKFRSFMKRNLRSFHTNSFSRKPLLPTRPSATKHSPNTYENVTPCLIPGPAVLTPGSSLESYIVPTDQHESFVRTLSSLMRTRENFPVGHTSQIPPSQARLTWRFFRDRLPKKKMHLVGMDILLILLSPGLGYQHPRGQDITIHPP
jgi:hypothetical protein